MNHDGCMHPDYCVVPRVIASLAMNPKSPADLAHLADMLSLFAGEMAKGEHKTTARVEFYERVAGLGPSLVMTHE